MANESPTRPPSRLLQPRRSNLARSCVDFPALLAMRQHDGSTTGLQRSPEMSPEPRTNWRMGGLANGTATEHDRGGGDMYRSCTT